MTLGAIEAFKAANRELVPMTGEDNNGLLKAWNESGSEGIGCAKPTWLARVALENAVKLMNGETVEKDQIYPVQTITTADIPNYVHPDLSDDVWCGTELPNEVLQEIFK
jgi:ribose transport system substrate-binding protein